MRAAPGPAASCLKLSGGLCPVNSGVERLELLQWIPNISAPPHEDSWSLDFFILEKTSGPSVGLTSLPLTGPSIKSIVPDYYSFTENEGIRRSDSVKGPQLQRGHGGLCAWSATPSNRLPWAWAPRAARDPGGATQGQREKGLVRRWGVGGRVPRSALPSVVGGSL